MITHADSCSAAPPPRDASASTPPGLSWVRAFGRPLDSPPSCGCARLDLNLGQLTYAFPTPAPQCARLPRKQYAPTSKDQQQECAEGRPTRSQSGQETAAHRVLGEGQRAALLDLIADDLADAIVADLLNDFEPARGFGGFPVRFQPKPR